MYFDKVTDNDSICLLTSQKISLNFTLSQKYSVSYQRAVFDLIKIFICFIFQYTVLQLKGEATKSWLWIIMMLCIAISGDCYGFYNPKKDFQIYTACSIVTGWNRVVWNECHKLEFWFVWKWMTLNDKLILNYLVTAPMGRN